MNYKKIILFLFIFIIGFFSFGFVTKTRAQQLTPPQITPYQELESEVMKNSLGSAIRGQLGNVAPASGLSSSDPRVVATSIIKVVLGILGVIFLALLFFAGFLWMTSGGDSKKVEKAQQLIKNSIIGLVIILAAYSIVLIVTVYLLRSTTYNQGATYQLPGGYPQY